MESRHRLTIAQSHVEVGDPHVTSDNRERLGILRALVEPLVRRLSEGGFEACLAAKWSVSSDARTWAFAIREGVRFHDGTPFTVEDCAVSLRRIRDSDITGELGTTGVIQSYLRESRIEVVASGRLVIELQRPNADFLDVVSEIPILKRHDIEEAGVRLVGTGPYRLCEVCEERVVIERNANYWGAPSIVTTVEWLALPSSAARLDALTEGSVDVAVALAADDRDGIAPDQDVALTWVRTPVCTVFMLDLMEGPLLDARVRQALNYGVDVPSLVTTTLGPDAAIPIAGPLTSRHLGFDGGVAGYGFQPDISRRLLDEASPESPLRITLDVPTHNPDEAVAMVARMAETLATIGIECSYSAHADRTAYAEMVRAKKLHDGACFDSSPASTHRTLREKFHSGVKGPWWLGYDNPNVNQAIEEAEAEPHTTVRRNHYRRAYRLISEDAPWLFLYNPSVLVGARRDSQALWGASFEGCVSPI